MCVIAHSRSIVTRCPSTNANSNRMTSCSLGNRISIISYFIGTANCNSVFSCRVNPITQANSSIGSNTASISALKSIVFVIVYVYNSLLTLQCVQLAYVYSVIVCSAVGYAADPAVAVNSNLVYNYVAIVQRDGRAAVSDGSDICQSTLNIHLVGQMSVLGVNLFNFGVFAVLQGGMLISLSLYNLQLGNVNCVREITACCHVGDLAGVLEILATILTLITNRHCSTICLPDCYFRL